MYRAHLSLFLAVLILTVNTAPTYAAPIVRGTGNGALAGATGNVGDLTDLGNNGVEGSYTYPAGAFPGNLGGFNATFFASSEAAFNGSEAAFNVFDNQVGGGANKWCCENPESGPGGALHVGADFSQTLAAGTLGIVLNRFTITSSNDSPDRDPDVWAIQGSNDGTTWSTIFSSNAVAPFTARDQVLEYSVANGDFATPLAFDRFRLFVDSTVNNNAFALGELEFFGNVVDTAIPEPTTFALWSLFAAGCLGFALHRRRRK